MGIRFPIVGPPVCLLRYPGEVRSLWHPPPNHTVAVLIAPPFISAIRVAVVDMRPVPFAIHSPRHTLPVLKLAAIVPSNIRKWNRTVVQYVVLNLCTLVELAPGQLHFQHPRLV